MIWNSDTETVSCISDPRCVASEHYVQPSGGESLESVPIGERGKIPIHKLHIVDYVRLLKPHGRHADKLTCSGAASRANTRTTITGGASSLTANGPGTL